MKRITQSHSVLDFYLGCDSNEKFTQTSLVSIAPSRLSVLDKKKPSITFSLNKSDITSDSSENLSGNKPVTSDTIVNDNLSGNKPVTSDTIVNDNQITENIIDYGDKDDELQGTETVSQDRLRASLEKENYVADVEDIVHRVEPEYQDTAIDVLSLVIDRQDTYIVKDLVPAKQSSSKMPPEPSDTDKSGLNKGRSKTFVPKQFSESEWIKPKVSNEKSKASLKDSTNNDNTPLKESSKTPSTELKAVSKENQSISSKIYHFVNWVKPKATENSSQDNIKISVEEKDSKNQEKSKHEEESQKENLEPSPKVSKLSNEKSKSETHLSENLPTANPSSALGLEAKIDNPSEITSLHIKEVHDSDKKSYETSNKSQEDSEVTSMASYSADFSLDNAILTVHNSVESLKSMFEDAEPVDTLKSTVQDIFHRIYTTTGDLRKPTADGRTFDNFENDNGTGPSKTIKESTLAHIYSKLSKLPNFLRFKDYNDTGSHFDRPTLSNLSNTMLEDKPQGIFAALKDRIRTFFEGKPHGPIVPHHLVINSDDNITIQLTSKTSEEADSVDPIQSSKVATVPINEEFKMADEDSTPASKKSSKQSIKPECNDDNCDDVIDRVIE